MRTPSLLRTISSRLISPSPVTPWPPARSKFGRWLSSELEELHQHQVQGCSSDANWLSKALDLSIVTQKMANSVLFLAANSSSSVSVDRKTVDEYLDDVVELLDACNGLRERMERIKNYVGSLAVALRWLQCGHDQPSAMTRAMAALDSCESTARRCAELEKCSSNLRKLGEKLAHGARLVDTVDGVDGAPTAEILEALSASKGVALFMVGFAGISLSFKSRRGLPMVQPCKLGSWGSSLNELHKGVKEELDKRRKDGLIALDELNLTATASRGLRDCLSRWVDKKGTCRPAELKVAAGELKMRCMDLEERVCPFEEKVDELYKELISIRMVLLGKFV